MRLFLAAGRSEENGYIPTSCGPCRQPDRAVFSRPEAFRRQVPRTCRVIDTWCLSKAKRRDVEATSTHRETTCGGPVAVPFDSCSHGYQKPGPVNKPDDVVAIPHLRLSLDTFARVSHAGCCPNDLHCRCCMQHNKGLMGWFAGCMHAGSEPVAPSLDTGL